MSLATLIKRLQDVMRKDPGVDGDVQRLAQFVWLIFLKVFDYKEEENELDDDYKPVIPEGYRWRDWANPLNDDGEPDVKNQLTGPELISFVDTKLIPVLRGDAIEINGKSTVVFDSNDDRALLVKQVMGDATNLMKNGYFLREVVNMFNEVDLAESADSHEFSEMYESLLDGLQAMGKYGEFHTVKAITKFGVDKVNPKLGETVADWACGTGGFLVDAIENLRKQVRLGHNEDFYQLQKSVRGGEFKPMPFRLCITNLLLHGIDLPNIRYGDSLDIKNFSEYYGDDLVDVACLNPPYGGVASDGDKLAFPADMRSSETADLFVALTVKRLKKNGRAIIVVPDGFLFGNDNAKVAIKKYLMKECNLHTIIRLPQSCFAPYTSIATNLLFFDKTGPTEETWFYRLDMPEGYKHFSKTKPLRREHFAPVDEWWDNRVEILDEKPHEDMSDTWKSKKYTIADFEANGYNIDFCGYPVEEKVILSPEDTIKAFIEKREALESELKIATDNMYAFLSGNTSVELKNVRSLTDKLSELNSSFPKNMRDAILQAAMQGKLTEQLSSDTDIRKYYEMVLSEEKIVSKKEKEVSFTGEEPFDIPSNWMWVKLNDLVGKEIRRGKSPKYAKNGTAMAFAQKCNSKHTGIRLDLALCLDDNSLSRYADHDKMQDLDVVINSTGGGTLGRIGLYKAEYNTDNKAYYPDSHVTVIRAKKCVSSLYIFRCLQYYSPYLETLGEGSTNQTELKPDVLKGLYIPLPPLEEQQRIVDKLDQLLPLCEQLERMAA